MTMDVSGLSPEDAFIEGIRAALQMTAAKGREGDTELVHVNEEEKAALKGMGGRGSINPETGLREYPPAGADIEGSGRGRDATGGGGGRDDAMARSAASRTAETRSISGRESQQGGVSSSPTSAGAPPGPVSDAPAPSDDRSLGERLAAGLEAAFSGSSLGAPTRSDPGFLGAAASLAPGIGWGMAATRGLQAMGVPNREKEEDEIGMSGYGPLGGQRDDRPLSPGAQKKPQATPQTAPWTRPGSAPTAPGGLGFDGGMTSLQQRSAIATGGTNADAGIYRDPAVVDYYRNLALFDLLGANNQPAQGAQVLPVEQQYLSQVTGAQPGSSLEDFLRALSGLQGQPA
jgi:hypothetical protein